ncbi:N-acetylmuramoyl-L-alanine amidase [Bacillus toyonensis]|nr:N-acetylmuramoyl-L-alanine amidase [Bacillus toyonensis]
MLVPIAIAFSIYPFFHTNVAYADDSYKTWKQYEGDWSDRLYVNSHGQYKFGDHVGEANKRKRWGTVTDWGCYLTAMAIQIKRSGAGPDGMTPWTFIEHMHNNGYMAGSDASDVGDAPTGVKTFSNGKFRASSSFQMRISGKSQEQKTQAIKTALDAGFYPVVKVKLGGGPHFVAIDRVENGKVYMFDPGSSKDDLFAQYGSTPEEIRVFESDVPVSKATGGSSGGGAPAEGGQQPQQPQQPDAKEQEKINVARMEWDEGKIKGMPKPRKWDEEPVKTIHISELDQVQQYSISKWKDEVKQSEKVDVTKIIRTALMVLGILMIIFSLIYLIAYVIDRVSFLEFKFFEWLTAGKLTASATGDSTFFSKNEGYPKLVNIRDLIIIETLLIGLSILLLSGGIFYVISQLIEAFKYMQGFLTKL